MGESDIETGDGAGYIKVFNILVFRKDSNFIDIDGWGYDINSLPALTDYINGTSEVKPGFFVAAMRRNTFKGIGICETLTICRFIMDDIIFEHQIIFTDAEYFYKIEVHIWGGDFGKEVRRELYDYFNDDGYWIKEKQTEIYEGFINFKKIPKYIENLFLFTNNIFNTIVFGDN